MYESDEEPSSSVEEMMRDETAEEAIAHVARHRAEQPSAATVRAQWRSFAVWGPCALAGAYWLDSVTGLVVGGVAGAAFVWLVRWARR